MSTEVDGVGITDPAVHGPDKDGFYEARMLVAGQLLRALSRSRLAALGMVLGEAGALVEAMAREIP